MDIKYLVENIIYYYLNWKMDNSEKIVQKYIYAFNEKIEINYLVYQKKIKFNYIENRKKCYLVILLLTKEQ